MKRAVFNDPLPTLSVPRRDLVPVHDVPPSRHVIRTPILILEVVGVLPDVDAQDRRLTLHERRVLIGSPEDGQLSARILAEPPPPRSELTDGRRLELGLELVERAELAL